MSTLTIEISDDVAARLEAASRRQSVPPSRIVQESLNQSLPMIKHEAKDGEPSLSEKMTGLIGCFDSGAGDLSTNPKHLEGFGQWRR